MVGSAPRNPPLANRGELEIPEGNLRIGKSSDLRGANGYLEYQDVLTRPAHMTGASTPEEILGFVRYLCRIAHRQEVFFLWRPWLRDPKDDMVLEAAVASQSRYIVTHNI